MIQAFRGFSMVLVAAATATCGLLMFSGAAPAAPGPHSSWATGNRAAHVAAEPPTTPSSTPGDSSTSTTTPTTTAPTTTITTTTTTPVASPVPRSVTASTTVVGAGGTIEFVGVCQEQAGRPLGPVIVWVIADSTERIDTGLTATDWTYRWTAPTDPTRFGSYAFQFWCGDPSGWQGGYPAGLQRTVDMVAQAGSPPTTTSPPADHSAAEAIPQTD